VSDVDPLALDRQVCFALAATSRSVIGLYRPVLEPLGLTHPQYLVMLALWERSPRTVRSVADALYLEPPTLTPLLKRLEALGLVTRRRDPDDERRVLVGLTAPGLALRDRLTDVPAVLFDRLGLGVDDARRLRELLARVG
jgi:DNA-binding MarR family transcriptional regulator